jgi:N-acyl-D-amino-acid deacylase
VIADGRFADITVFNPDTIDDPATYENPHQYAVGVRHVIVNGRAIIQAGEPLTSKPWPGRYLRFHQ